MLEAGCWSGQSSTSTVQCPLAHGQTVPLAVILWELWPNLTSSDRSSLLTESSFALRPRTTAGRPEDLPGPGGLLRCVPWFSDPAKPPSPHQSGSVGVAFGPSDSLGTSFVGFRGSIARPAPAACQLFACCLATTGAWFAEKVVGWPFFLPGLSPGDIPPVSLALQMRQSRTPRHVIPPTRRSFTGPLAQILMKIGGKPALPDGPEHGTFRSFSQRSP